MNIQERNQYIGLHNQLADLGKKNDNLTAEFINANSYWDNLYRPPLYQYIPQYVFTKLHEYINDRRLYNRPKERFKVVNELLEPIGLKPLASGTNRRTFYCTYDPNIVFKLASDSVGMSDNLNEFTMQKLLKPFFAKMFSVTPDGLMSLSERVETMKEKDYKLIWSEHIFQIINDLLMRGYIMEDIGSNFFKNWGIRIGYGPVLLDCPYIYKVDKSKLKCPRIINRLTGEICNGEIDYNYEKGMSEIICTKCGTRYYASELAERYPSESFTKIVKGREYRMGMIDTNVKVQITKGDQVVNRYFIETDSQEYSDNQGARRYTVDPFNPNLRNNSNNFPYAQTNIHSVVTNVTHNIPMPDGSMNNYTVPEYATSYNLFGIDIPITLVNTIKINCNIDLMKISENDLYTYLTRNTAQEYWIERMSSEEYKIFSDIANKFVSNYLNKSNYSSGNGDPLINIFGSLIYKSIANKIEKALNFNFNSILDVNVLYNHLVNEKNNNIIRSELYENEYVVFKSFIATLAALNMDKISFLNSELLKPTWDLVKLCNNPINKALYQKLEAITKLQFSKIDDNDSLAKYFIASKDALIQQMTETESVQFQYFIESISSDQNVNGEIIKTTPLLQSQSESSNIKTPFDITQTNSENAIPIPVFDNQENIQSVEEDQKELEKIITNEEPEKDVLSNEIVSSNETDNIDKVDEQKYSLSFDEHGNTIGRIPDWSEYYRNYIKYTLYPRDVKNDIIYFLKKVENKFGYIAADFISKKLGVKYIKADEYDKDKNQATISLQPVTSVNDTKRSINDEEANKSESKVSKKYVISSQTEANLSEKLINPETDWKTRDKDIEIEKTVETDPNKEYFVEKAKTPEELAAMADEKLKNSNAIMGVIGEPKVDFLRNKELIPILKDKIFAKFNNIELETNVDIQMKDLQKYIKHYIFEEMKLITRDDGSGIGVNIIRSADERNRDCFKIAVSNNNAVIFEVIIYPAKDESITEKKTIRERMQYKVEDVGFDVYEFLNNERKLYEFLNQKVKEYDTSNLRTVEEAQKVLIGYLYSCLVDYVKGGASSPLIMRICTDYVMNQCNINANNIPEEKEEELPAYTSMVNKEESGNTIADQI